MTLMFSHNIYLRCKLPLILKSLILLRNQYVLQEKVWLVLHDTIGQQEKNTVTINEVNDNFTASFLDK